MKKVNEAHSQGCLIGYTMHCPGCNHMHVIYTNYRDHPCWTFNGDVEKPTFSPSLLVTWNEGKKKTKKRCHSFIRNGQWRFLNDCTHALAGKTVDMLEVN